MVYKYLNYNVGISCNKTTWRKKYCQWNQFYDMEWSDGFGCIFKCKRYYGVEVGKTGLSKHKIDVCNSILLLIVFFKVK